MIENSDLIITGEEKIDAQTLNIKAPMGVLSIARAKNIPVIAIAGQVNDAQLLNENGFSAIFSTQRGVSTLSMAMNSNNARINIENTIEQIMRVVKSCNPLLEK